MKGSSEITLKKSAVFNNIFFLKKKLGSKVKISSVVKANAYGHGIEHIVPLFAEAGIDHFAVFSYEEALRVKNVTSPETEIMIMGWISDENISEAVQRGLDFFVFNKKRLELALKASQKSGIKAKIHVEAETGMNRSGLNSAALNEAAELILQNPDNFELKGFCTHLSGPESISNHLRIQNQIRTYNKMLNLFEQKGLVPKYRHIANSAASFVYPKTRLDLVRIGIMQYGFWSSAETFIHYISNKKSKADPLQRILGWNSKIMSIKKIKIGEFIGYGTSYLAQNDITTALIPVGYSSGYNRSLSNKGRVLIHGKRCGVIGVVNMNMIIADITQIPDTKVDDEVVIIGTQGDLEIKVSAFSNIADQLNYEILAHLPKDINRKII